MNRTAERLRTPAVSLRAFDHPHGAEHQDPEEEVTRADSISFVEGGGFGVRLGRQEWRVSAGALFVTTRGMIFSCRHDSAEPSDRCLSVIFSDQASEDLRGAGLPALRPPVAPVGPRQRYLRHRLESAGPGQELHLEVLAGALFESLAASGTMAKPRPDWYVSDVMRRLDRAVDLIESGYAQPLTLADLAGAAGLSPWHFVRVFRTTVGLPPHRYLTAVRLRRAAQRLDQGESVTRACYDCGFGSLSHFITAFRKRYGVVPSAVKRGARYPALRSALGSPLWRQP
ncbi:MAG: AraC family transcriptional regulator [Gemmatimonadales bacterium]